VEKEHELLSKTKDCVERAYEAKQVPMDVTFECLSSREQRQDTDLVRDDVEAQLHKEVEVIEGMKNVLIQKHEEAFEQLCVLQDVIQMVNSDLLDKDTALDIDQGCHELENASGTISLHRDPTRIMRGIVTVDTWDAFSAHNKGKADDEVKTSIHLREAMNQIVLQTTSDLEAQWTATSYAFRKRIHETEQAVRELDWQMKNTQEEIESVQKEVDNLKESIAEKLPPLMVAHTRLEDRTTRPNVELCRDVPQYQLVGEVEEVKESQWSLQEKLAVAEQTLGRLQRTLAQITTELAIKQNSLHIDQNCMEVREKLKKHPSGEELIKHA
jgi:tektin-2